MNIIVESDRDPKESPKISSETMRYRRHRSPSKSLRKRTRIALILLELCFVFLVFRLFMIQCINGNELNAQAKSQKLKTISVQSKRGEIFDRNGKQLAVTVKSYSLFADPSTVKNPESVSKCLAPIIGISDKELMLKLQTNKRFIWLKRQLPDQIANKIRLLGMKGLGFREEEKRFYPCGQLASHVIGFVGFDDEGLEGLEKKYNAHIRVKTDEFNTLCDRKGRYLEPQLASYRQSEPGNDLTLTIDSVIQNIVENELQSAYEKNSAVGGSVIVMNPKTGEILALANYPTYNLNEAYNAPDDSKRNRAMMDLYEPGSVFKVITASSAINENLFNINDNIYCEKGIYNNNGFIIHDTGNYGNLSFSKVIEESSNIGTVKIADRLGSKRFYDYIKAFGFGEKTGIDMNETKGYIKSPSNWTASSMGAIPYGQEISVTAIQMLSAFNAIANDGVIMKPISVKKITNNQGTAKEFSPSILRKPISADTAQMMKNILVNAVNNGTGQNAKMDNYSVAGKMGTSQKANEDKTGYIPGKYVSSFAGFFPADDPLISMIVIIDEPKGEYLGGVVACPVFRAIATQIMQYLTIGQGICVAKVK